MILFPQSFYLLYFVCVKQNLNTTQFGFACKRQRPSGSAETWKPISVVQLFAFTWATWQTNRSRPQWTLQSPFTNTLPPIAGMMLLATIGVGDKIKALGLWWQCECMSEGVTRLGEWGITWEHWFERQRMLCMPNEKETSWKATFEAEWMTLRTSLCLFNRMLFLWKTPPPHSSYPSPMPPPATHTLT